MVTGKAAPDRHENCRFEVFDTINEINIGKYEGVVRTDVEYQAEK